MSSYKQSSKGVFGLVANVILGFHLGQRLKMLDGRGNPLRFICVGCRRPDGFGMPDAPVVTCVNFKPSACVSNASLCFVSLSYRLPREDAEERLCNVNIVTLRIFFKY